MEEKKEEVVKEEVKEAEVVTKKANSSALASFICSLIGLLICGLPLGIAAIITGVNGLTSFKPDKENNKWMAITGLCIGIVDVVCVIIYMTTVYGK